MARQGVIKNFTGIDDPYEEPENAEMVLNTDRMTVEECVKEIIRFLEEKEYLGEGPFPISHPE